MKHFYQLLFTAMFMFSIAITFGNTLLEEDSVSMGFGYANDVYYSMENGEVHSANRTNWDLGFYTNSYSAAIITNDGNGVVLYTYQNSDTTGWNSIDTTGLSGWKELYNSHDEWEDGAFNRNATGHPDYGWCIYNPITHNLIGDSLYIVKFSDGSAKKLWIQYKHSEASTYYFKYADLDGANEVTEVVNCTDYADKNFLYYSMQTQEVIDRDPVSEGWDILFTKYMGESNGQPYILTGVVNNVGVKGNSFVPVDPAYTDWAASKLDSIKITIGADWKKYSGGYVIEDSTIFFVNNLQQNVYRLVMTGFDGMSTGNIYFEKELASLASVNESFSDAKFNLYPNPANQFVTINIEDEGDWNEVIVSDLTGKTIISQKVNGPALKLQLNNLQPGMYLVSLRSENKSTTRKLIIRNN